MRAILEEIYSTFVPDEGKDGLTSLMLWCDKTENEEKVSSPAG
jgi:hypothetical protein